MAEDENGKPAGGRRSQGRVESLAQADASAVELELPWRCRRGGVGQIARFDGSLQAMVPGKIETFRFRQSADRQKRGEAHRRRHRDPGAGAEEQRLWEVPMRVRFDDAGNSLESFRGWILQNKAFLEDPDGKRIPYISHDTTQRAKTKSA